MQGKEDTRMKQNKRIGSVFSLNISGIQSLQSELLWKHFKFDLVWLLNSDKFKINKHFFFLSERKRMKRRTLKYGLIFICEKIKSSTTGLLIHLQ